MKMAYTGVGMPTGYGAGVPPLGAEQPSMPTTTPRVYAGESVLDQVFGTMWNMVTSVLGTLADTAAWVWRPLRDSVWSTASWMAATVQSTLAQFPMLRAFWGTLLALGVYYASYYALNLASSSIGTAQQMGIAPTGPITGMVKEMSAETARGLQGTKEMLVGA
ncbi:hypothetical protein AMAG_20187 [Allomyces macrogynus ATCC 38327]|uniref:Uncharacterized protein n=1 Tax=Allomyces macrogynus (strain ATCC 38327) TaxID=578462 RepID=A0A0L0T823_ALLM3|nr:hypothetical protein AMAG_20187 [Allomyces macrogynus ATCC 38327]|eukprot:KNE70846.1 hypothetical protein AMAG_20187 [Allomyces macrogynus ATCC 38327]